MDGREAISRGIAEDEKLYCDKLAQFSEFYIDTCKKCGLLTSLGKEISILIPVHSMYYNNMNTCINNWNANSDIAIVFLIFVSYLNIYSSLISQSDKIFAEITKLREQKQFREIENDVIRHPNGYPIEYYVNLVIQRIVFYSYQYQELLNNTNATHASYHNVVMAIEKCQYLIDRMQIKSKGAANMQKVLKYSDELEVEILNPLQVFVYEGEVQFGTKKNLCSIVLFYDCFLIIQNSGLFVKSRKMTHKFDFKNTSSIEVVSDGNNNLLAYNEENKMIFIFACKSEREREDWFERFKLTLNAFKLKAPKHTSF